MRLNFVRRLRRRRLLADTSRGTHARRADADAEESSNARLELLYRLASSLSRADSLEEVFEPALDAVCEGLGVDRASLLLLDDDGSFHYRAWRGLSDRYRAAIGALASSSMPDPHDPEPLVAEDTARREELAPFRDVFEAEEIRSLVLLPLLHENRFLGKLMVYGRQVRAFDSEELRLGSTVAGQVAQAISRRLAEAQTRRARAFAEEAVRAREDVLAIVAHDLGNPLGVIRFRAQRVLASPLEGERGESTKREVASIFRSALHMKRIIDDLLDAAAIDAKRLSVLRLPCGVEEVLAEAVELARPLAEHRKLRLELRVDVGEALWNCDHQRVVQVISNLAGNAIKFSPEGGTVTLEASASESEVLVAVCDEGPGIALADRERVFERGVRVGRPAYEGLGLGLFVAKGLVIAHGGRIWIDDGCPSGTRIVFALPRVTDP